MKILQRYALKEIIGPAALGLVVFTFVFLVAQVFKLADHLLNSGIPAKLAGELILLILPSVMSVTIPMALLVGVLLGVGRLAADREILATRASGISLFFLAKPIIGFSVLLCGLMMWANMRVIPYFNLKGQDLQVQVLFHALSSIPAGIPFPLEGEENDSTIFIDSKDPKTGKMNGISILAQLKSSKKTSRNLTQISDLNSTAIKSGLKEKKKDHKSGNGKKKKKHSKQEAKQTREEKLAERRADENQEWNELLNEPIQNVLILAESGEFDPVIADRVVYVRLSTGSIHLTDPKAKGSYDIIHFASLKKGIVPNFDKFEHGSFEKEPKEMSFSELRKQIKIRDKGHKYSIELYQRFSLPLACVAFALIALPLAVYVRPTGKAVAFAISFLLILFYYGLLEYGVAIGHANSPLGPVAIFLPNLVIAGIGSFMLYRVVMK